MAGNLEILGYTVSPLDNPRQNPRRVYYRPRTGIPTLPLPADPYHTKLFLNSGFTLEPPSGEVVSAEPKRKYKHTRKFLKKQARKNSKKGG
ncbi:hypothetical protein LCGC14_2409440 [marine sediment metagenome]|uniref:Uncharacterized protein n=1 Tax=marine sediment metagenome TaxID=412755 RepID=A0A0F9CF22_9ZZZZ